MISLTTAALQTGSRVASAYAEARAAAAPSPTAAAPQGFSAAARDFAAVMEQADTVAVGAMQGRNDTQALVQSIAEAQMALGRFGVAEEVAKTVVFLASPASSYTTGTNVVIDGGYTKRVQF